MIGAAPQGNSIEALLRHARNSSDLASTLEAQLLLGRVLRRERSWVLAHPEAVLTTGQLAEYRSRLQRLLSGEPLPYLLEHWEFYGRAFQVAPEVLIPRPETELMVDVALDLGERARRILDLGTGSGCVAVTLAAELPGARVLGSDRSVAALRLARANAVRHAVGDRVQLVAADLLAPLAGPFDLICANLPYIPSGVLAHLPVGRREPVLALDGGRDGLRLIRPALRQLARVLRPDGLALFEIDSNQAQAATGLAQRALPGSRIDIERDLAGRKRLLVIRRG